MYRYSAYGLDICSELQLPELVSRDEGESPLDSVTIRRGEVAHLAGAEPYGDRIISEQQYLIWNLIGCVLVRGGQEIIAEPAPDIDEGLLRMLLLGRCSGVLLNQRGRLVLHASSVTIERAGGGVARVAAFLGASGAGKSTLAAAMVAGGSAIAGDDLLPVISGSEEPRVDAGFPALKLEPEAAVSLGVTNEALPSLHPEVSERYYAMPEGFRAGPLALGAVYVIERGEGNRIEPLTRQQGCLELLRYSFAADLLTEQDARKLHFVSCATLADSVPIRRLQVGDTIGKLAEVPQLVRADIAALEAA